MARAAKKETPLTTEEKLAKALVPEEEQPYPVPENWCWILLGGIATIKRGASPRPIKEYITNDEGGVNWIKIGDTDSNKYVTHVQEKITLEGAKKSVFAERGTLLLSNSMSFGRPYILNIEGCIHDGWLAIAPGSALDKEYLYYALLMSNTYFESVATGTTVRNLNSKRVSVAPIPLPPLPEQQRIVTLIESLFADLDAAKEKLQAVLDGFAERRAALLHQAFTGEVTREWREAHGLSVDDWISQTLKECCNIGSGGTPSRKNLSFYEGDIPWVKTKEIDWHEIHDTEEHISQEAIDNSSARLYNKGAVLVAMYGMGVTRGRAAILSIAAATNQAVCVLEPQKHLTNRFLFYYFMANYWTIRSKAVGGNQLNLSGTLISKFKINIPPLPEQKEIVRILDDIFAKESQSKAAVESALAKIDTMKKAILATAFRGGFETNNSSDESAKELLRKVL